MAKTSLFTDIVGSTETAVALGDAAWADLLEHHHSLVRTHIGRFSGEEMNTTGDGFFVIFPEPTAAIEAGQGIVEAMRPLGLALRIGIHHGDCYVADGKCSGLAIHIAARIVALAEPEELLVSEPAMTKAQANYRFSDRGTHTLKGIPGTWRLFAVL